MRFPLQAVYLCLLLWSFQSVCTSPPHQWCMSSNQLGSLGRRQSGYRPETLVCGTGDTCAQACGNGFEQCQSQDTILHCFDPGHGQTCCPGGTGKACDTGFYCATDIVGKVYCCPDAISLAQCAAANGANSLGTAFQTSTTTAMVAVQTIVSVIKTQMITVQVTATLTSVSTLLSRANATTTAGLLSPSSSNASNGTLSASVVQFTGAARNLSTVQAWAGLWSWMLGILVML